MAALDAAGVRSVRLQRLTPRLLIPLEATLGALAILGVHRQVVAAAVVLVTLPFTLFLLRLRVVAPDVPCGCLGEREAGMGRPSLRPVLRNVLLALLAGYVALMASGGAPGSSSSVARSGFAHGLALALAASYAAILTP